MVGGRSRMLFTGILAFGAWSVIDMSEVECAGIEVVSRRCLSSVVSFEVAGMGDCVSRYCFWA